MRARFITLEGVEGAGKSTHAAFVKAHLEAAGADVVLTREPGGTAVGEVIRELLLGRDMAVDCELLLMFAARAEHLQRVILPALEAGRWVVSDRFTDATYAYQGGGRGVPVDRIAVLENWVQGPLRPDLTLLLDLPPEQGLARAGRRGRADRFEREQLDFFRRIRECYLARAESEPDRICRIDAGAGMESVKEAIGTTLDRMLLP